MYNGSSDNGYRNDDYGASGNYLNRGYHGDGHVRVRNGAGASSCRSWMIASLVLQVVALLFSPLGLVAFVISLVSMFKVKGFLAANRMRAEASRVFTVLCLYASVVGLLSMMTFYYAYRLIMKTHLGHEVLAPSETTKLVIDEISRSGTASLMFGGLGLAYLIIMVYSLYVWIKTYQDLDSF